MRWRLAKKRLMAQPQTPRDMAPWRRMAQHVWRWKMRWSERRAFAGRRSQPNSKPR